MFFRSKRLEERAEGLKALNEIFEKRSKAIIIHYSCESFLNTHGRTPRVTSISSRYLDNGQTKSFSIHIQAQIEGKDFNNLREGEYDFLEKRMLDDYFSFVESRRDYCWIHWNMRDSNYGFDAIENRHKILKGIPAVIDADRRYDLSRILGQIYTYDFAPHMPDGKFLNLINSNGINNQGALKGKEEAVAFEEKEYLKLHISTLRKVYMMESLLSKAYNKKLKVTSSNKEVYGYSIPGVIEIVRNNWMLTTLYAIVIFIIGIWAQPFIMRFFGI